MIYVAFALAGLATFLLRATPTLAAGVAARVQVDTWIRFVSPAALAAIITSALVLESDRVVAPTLPEAAAIGAAVIATHRTKNVAISLAVGLPVYWAMSLVAG